MTPTAMIRQWSSPGPRVRLLQQESERTRQRVVPGEPSYTFILWTVTAAAHHKALNPPGHKRKACSEPSKDKISPACSFSIGGGPGAGSLRLNLG